MHMASNIETITSVFTSFFSRKFIHISSDLTFTWYNDYTVVHEN